MLAAVTAKTSHDPAVEQTLDGYLVYTLTHFRPMCNHQHLNEFQNTLAALNKSTTKLTSHRQSVQLTTAKRQEYQINLCIVL